MQRPIEWTASTMARAVNAREVLARELVTQTLRQVDENDRQIGAYLTRLDQLALHTAEQVDRRIADGDRFPLAGVPLAVKDNMCLSQTRTTAGSKILDNWVAPYTATAVQRMIDAGAIPIGKTNLDEFAMGSSCETSALAVTRNP